MDKIKILIGAIIVSAIILTVFWLFFVFSSSSVEPDSSIQTQKQDQGSDDELATVDVVAIPPLITEQGCSGITNRVRRDACRNMELMGRAAGSQDPSLCKQITDVNYRDHCIRVISQALQNVAACRAISQKEWENVCIMEIAHGKMDPTVCDGIDYPYTKKKCKIQINTDNARLEQSMEDCAALPMASTFRNECIWLVANIKGADACKTIESADIKTICIDGYYLSKARSASDMSLCGNISSEIYKTICKKTVKLALGGKATGFDTDKDGLTDIFELSLNTDPYSQDTDKDGITDYVELYEYHADPLNPDTDGDGRIDGDEQKEGKDINVPD